MGRALRRDIARRMAYRMGVSTGEAERIIRAFEASIIEGLKRDGIVEIRDFFKFSSRPRWGRLRRTKYVAHITLRRRVARLQAKYEREEEIRRARLRAAGFSED